MPDAVYKQALEQVQTQLSSIVPYSTAGSIATDAVQVRQLDWDDVHKLAGLTVRYDEASIREIVEGTNERDIIGYPCHVVHNQGMKIQLIEEIPNLVLLFQNIRRYFHNKRRMSAVSDTNVNEYGPTIVTRGPKVPAKYRDRAIRTVTVWCWFLEPRTS